MSAIVILLANDHTRTVVAQGLIPHDRVLFDWPAGPDPLPIDAIVADASSLHAHGGCIADARRRRQPRLLPVLLLGERCNVARLDERIWDIVDDVALRPLDERELRLRIDVLLQRRDASHDARVAQRFQEAALPRTMPRVPGLTFGAFYRPGIDERRNGGDWYDALALSDGRVLFSIGDVCGSGLDAAVAMASVRQVFRGVAHINPDPAIVLDAAHRTLCVDNPESLVTAFVGVFDPITGLLSYASAGHPRPFLRKSDGSIVELAGSGGPLGLPFSVERSVNLVDMPLGSLLVLYTNGLTEASRDPLAGEAVVRGALASEQVCAAPNVAFAIHAAVIGEPSADDVAILTIAHVERDLASERLSHWSFDARDPGAARDVRGELVAELQRVQLSDAGIANAELVFSELIGNVVRYAARWVDVTLDASGAAPVLHVLDGGPGFRYLPRLPADVLSEHGRGLFIVAQLTDDFHVTKRPHGGSHARAVLSRA